MSYHKEMRKIGFKIWNERNYAGMSQKQLPEKANITQQQLSKIENGAIVNMGKLTKVCKALGFIINLSINEP